MVGESELVTTAGFLVLAALFVLVAVALWRRLERGPNGEMPYEVTIATGVHALQEVRTREIRAIGISALVIAAGWYYGLWAYLGTSALIGLVYVAFRISDLAIANRALRLCSEPGRATVFGGCLVIRNQRERSSVFLTRRARDGVLPPARTSL